MNKISKLMFLSLIIISLTIGLTAISASDISNNYTDTDNVNQISDEISYKDTNNINDNNMINTHQQEEELEQTQSNAYTTTYTKQITPNNYQTELTTINDDTTYDFSGTFTNMGTYTFTNLDTVIFTSSQNNAYFTNTQLTVQGTKIEISNLNISNTDTTVDSVILTYDSTKVYIHDNRINTTTNNNNENHAISARTSNLVNITDNKIKTEGYHQDMGWNNNSGEWTGAILVSGIELAGTSNTNITSNNVTVLNLNTARNGYESIEGVTIKGSASENILVNNNNITVRDANYNYGTTVSAGATNVTFDNNTFNITGPHYACGVQVDNTDNSYIINNTIYAIANGTNLNSTEEQLAYGIILTCWNVGDCDHNTIANNYIKLTAHIGYGIELFMARYTNITNNTITVIGFESMCIGAYQSSYNNITTNNMNFSTTPGSVKTIYEMITPTATGVYLTSNSNNNILYMNRIVGRYFGTTYNIYIISSSNTYLITTTNLLILQKYINNNQFVFVTGYNTVSGTYSTTLPSTSASLLQTPKSVKKDAQSIIITASNFDEYVTDGLLNDKINAGDTLDFQGLFDHPRFKLTVNKPVNIISSTHDAYYSLNTSSTNFFGEDSGDSFIINKEGSGTNLSDVKFYNTQLFLLNASNVNIDNISVINENQQIGSGVGVTSIRDQSINITVKNSYFKTKDNLGHSTLVFGWAENVLVENNVLEVEGQVGNILYFTTWNVKDNGENATEGYYNKNITIKNNTLRGKDNSIASICYAIAIEGENHVIKDNLIDYAGTCISPQWGIGSQRNISFINNTITKGTSYIGFVNSTIINNTINNATISRAIVSGNTFNQVNIQDNVNFTNNNVINNTQISGNNVIFENNNITSPDDYAINISSSLENITINNNMINSNNKKGNDAILSSSEYSSENNDGWTVLYLNDNNMDEYFDILEPNFELGIFGSGITWKGPDKNIIGIINITSERRGSSMKLTGKNMFTLKSNMAEIDLDPETTLFNTSVRYDTLKSINNYESERYGYVLQGNLINCILAQDMGPMYFEWGMISEYTPITAVNTTFLQYEADYGSEIVDVFYLSDETYDLGFDGNTLKDNFGKTNILLGNLTKPIILNKAFNITPAPGFGKIVNITLVSGSEGTNITDLTIDGDLTINVENVSVKNTTINGNLLVNANKADIHDNNITKNINLSSSTNSIINDNNINGSINILTSDNNIISNNNIITSNENTVISDLYSLGNNITNNYLMANNKTGDNSVVKGLNNLKDNTPLKEVILTINLNTTNTPVLENVSANVHISCNDDIINTGNIVLLVNGIPETPVDVTNNMANISFAANECGNLTIKAWYFADGLYNDNYSNTTILIVNKRQTSISIEETSGKIGNLITIKANITDNNGAVESGNVTIITNDNNYTANIENGIITKDIILSTSPSIVKIVYEGSEINSPANASKLVTLEKLNSDITITQLASDDENAIIDVEVYGENGEIINEETITFIKNNEILSTITLINSKAQLTSNLDIGTTITAMFRGNNIYNPTSANITIKNMTKYIKVDKITSTVGNTINISAKIQADNTTLNINKGKVSFKVNGKTLKDSNGKIIYAKVVNGTATIENYEVPESWTKENSTIQAVYSGSTEYIKLNSDKELINITEQNPTITTNNINTTVNSTITLKATINAGNTLINTGKIVFKINGKTVKDTNGKVIYAKVTNNTVNVEYTIPASYKIGNYTITAVYTSVDYPKLEDTKVLTIN